MNIFFRSDASLQIGTGHIIRCLTLAEELKKRGSEISFICREEKGNLIESIRKKNFKVYPLPAETGTGSEMALIQTILTDQAETPEWLIIDHYDIHSSWESSVRNLVKKIMVIDDLADRRHDCDLLLDQNYNGNPDRYHQLVPDACTRLSGPAYALLQPQFGKARENLKQRTGIVKRIFVFLGGADINNHTSKILRAIKKLDTNNITVDVVIGLSNPNREEIEQLASGLHNAKCHYNVNNMAELMADSDLAIGAGGTTTWERCCLALPSMVMSIADNQTEIAEQLSNEGYILYIGNSDVITEEDIINKLKFMLGHPEIVRSLSLKAKQLTDGKGTERVCSYLYNSSESVRLRPAESEDCRRVFEWRNHPKTRESCFDPSPLQWESHEKWFLNALSVPEVILLIGENSNGPAGVLRYDLKADKATVSIYLVPGLKNKGIGTSMLKLGSSWIKDKHPEIEQIIAEIKTGNAPSIKSFTKAGFSKDHLAFTFNLGNKTHD